jgi:hypothetical protein
MSRKSKKTGQKPNATALATKAGCSRQLVSRLLARGLSEQQIIDRTRERKAREVARSRGAGHVNGHTNGLDLGEFPTVPVPPFAVSEAKKEHHLAEIRGLQAAKLRGQVFPIEPIRSIVFAATHFLVNRLRDLPDELTDELGPALTKLLRVRLYALVEEAHRVLCWECQRHGAPPPPPAPPEPVRQRLAYYERYIRDSRLGEIEVIPINERMESAEWQRQHPSVSFEQWFEIKRKKAAWDQAMGELLARRVEWDLPSELPDEPPPEPPEAA